VQSDGLNPEPTAPPRVKFWNERRLLYLELILICSLGAGGGLLKVAFDTFNPSLSAGTYGGGAGILNWAYKLINNISVICLVWYVLLRRSKSFSDLGFSFLGKDIWLSIVLWLAGCLIYGCIFGALNSMGFAITTYANTWESTGNYLYHSGISIVTWLAIIVNPFFEEIVLRAYLMTMVKQLTNSTVIAISASAVIEAIPHLYQGVPSMISLFGLFLFYSIYYAKTNRIFPLILAHLYSDVGGTIGYYFYSTMKMHHG
jgi:membrane protease YdiL (CAAX protease family)